MLNTGYVIDPRYQNHEIPLGHPERPERIAALLDLMQGYRRQNLVKIEPRSATTDELRTTHDGDYIDQVRASAGESHIAYDLDTHAFGKTYETALLSAGGFLELLDRIMEKKIDNGFAMVRPPGHHAEYGRAMGFCFFNNVAIGARYLQNKYKLGRILIVDWDVHHGNGTEHSFYADNSVLFVSTHQYPHYPGTGAVGDTGMDKGIGFNVNIPLPAGCGNGEYIESFRRIVEPISEQFDPDFVLISAGFDCHQNDTLSGMRVTTGGFAAMTQRLLGIANKHADGRCAAVLEGGYDLDGLSESVACVLDELGGEDRKGEPASGGVVAALDDVCRAQQDYWNL